MQSRRFGVAWLVHQTLPRFAGEPPLSASAREAAALAAFALSEVLPCKFCRRSYRDFCRMAHLKRRLQDASALSVASHERYYFDVHNLVNAKLGKPVLAHMQPTFERHGTVPLHDVDRFRCALTDWMMMVVTNYQPLPSTASCARALRAVRQAAACSDGRFWRLARRNDVTLGSAVTAFVDANAPADVRSDARLAAWWRKAAWHVFYFEALLRMMSGPRAPAAVQQCARALRRYLQLRRRFGAQCDIDVADHANAKDRSVPQEPFLNGALLFDAIYAARHECAPATCPSRDELRQQFDSYRAGRCRGHECV